MSLVRVMVSCDACGVQGEAVIPTDLDGGYPRLPAGWIGDPMHPLEGAMACSARCARSLWEGIDRSTAPSMVAGGESQAAPTTQDRVRCRARAAFDTGERPTTVHPFLKGRQVEVVYRSVVRACEFEVFIHQAATDELKAHMVAKLESVLRGHVAEGKTIGAVAQLILDSGPFKFEGEDDPRTLKLFSYHQLVVCFDCDAMSLPVKPVYPWSRIGVTPAGWEAIAAGGAASYLCPSCVRGR